MGKLHHNKSIMYSFLSTILPYVVEPTRKFLKNKNRNAVYNINTKHFYQYYTRKFHCYKLPKSMFTLKKIFSCSLIQSSTLTTYNNNAHMSCSPWQTLTYMQIVLWFKQKCSNIWIKFKSYKELFPLTHFTKM